MNVWVYHWWGKVALVIGLHCKHGQFYKDGKQSLLVLTNAIHASNATFVRIGLHRAVCYA
jgi:hypothetical protein